MTKSSDENRGEALFRILLPKKKKLPLTKVSKVLLNNTNVVLIEDDRTCCVAEKYHGTVLNKNGSTACQFKLDTTEFSPLIECLSELKKRPEAFIKTTGHGCSWSYENYFNLANESRLDCSWVIGTTQGSKFRDQLVAYVIQKSSDPSILAKIAETGCRSELDFEKADCATELSFLKILKSKLAVSDQTKSLSAAVENQIKQSINALSQ